MILALESSCDETAVALFDPSVGIRGEWIHSQIALQERYGGVVPDLATREHLRKNGGQFNAETILGGKLVRAAVLADLAQPRHIMGGQHHDGDCGKTAAKHLGSLQTAHTLHLKVHEHQIGLQLANSDERLVGTAGDPYNFNVGVIFKEGTERAYKRR